MLIIGIVIVQLNFLVSLGCGPQPPVGNAETSEIQEATPQNPLEQVIVPFPNSEIPDATWPSPIQPASIPTPEEPVGVPIPPVTSPPPIEPSTDAAASVTPTIAFMDKPLQKYGVYLGSRLAIDFSLQDDGKGGVTTFRLESSTGGNARINEQGIFTYDASSGLVGTLHQFKLIANTSDRELAHDFIVEVHDSSQEMVRIGSYSIDPYEAVISYSAGCEAGTYYSQVKGNDDLPADFPDDVGTEGNTLPGSTRFYACSLPAVLPSRGLTLVQALQACSNVGKRLCTYMEMLEACAEAEAQNCNWNGGDTIPTGSKSNCAGRYQVYDLLGNIKEWTSSLQCNPEDVIECGRQCRFLQDEKWCSDTQNLAMLVRPKSLSSTGYLLPGGFYDVNGIDYASCGGYAYERVIAETSSEAIGMRCCKD